MGLEAEALSFKRDRTSTCERIENRRELAVVALADLCARLSEQALVVAVLPENELLKQSMESGPLPILGSCRGKLVWMR